MSANMHPSALTCVEESSALSLDFTPDLLASMCATRAALKSMKSSPAKSDGACLWVQLVVAVDKREQVAHEGGRSQGGDFYQVRDRYLDFLRLWVPGVCVEVGLSITYFRIMLMRYDDFHHHDSFLV